MYLWSANHYTIRPLVIQVNTASRMESTGIPDRVQVSQETADLLTLAGKSHWSVPRRDKVTAKGKGELQTYFLKQSPAERAGRSGLTSDGDSSSGGSVRSDYDGFESSRDQAEAVEKRNRLADWTVEVMACLLKEIAARRHACNVREDSRNKMDVLEHPSTSFTVPAPSPRREEKKHLNASYLAKRLSKVNKRKSSPRTVIDEVEEIIKVLQ